MKSMGDRLGIVVATCVIAAAAFALVETAKPDWSAATEAPQPHAEGERESVVG
jgi:hypothetical protein